MIAPLCGALLEGTLHPQRLVLKAPLRLTRRRVPMGGHASGGSQMVEGQPSAGRRDWCLLLHLHFTAEKWGHRWRHQLAQFVLDVPSRQARTSWSPH